MPKNEEKMELKTDAEVDQEIMAMELGYERRCKWYLCEIEGKKLVLPDTTDAYGWDIYETKRHKRKPIPEDMSVYIYPERYLCWPLAGSQFLKKVKYSEIPLGWLIKPGVMDTIELEKSLEVLK